MNWKKIGYTLGLTKELRYELSDTLNEAAEVTAKRHVPENNAFIFMGLVFPEEYNISFKGNTTNFQINDKSLYENFEVGDKVRVNYQNKHLASFDYRPPNFGEKEPIKKKFIEHKFVGATKEEPRTTYLGTQQ